MDTCTLHIERYVWSILEILVSLLIYLRRMVLNDIELIMIEFRTYVDYIPGKSTREERGILLFYKTM